MANLDSVEPMRLQIFVFAVNEEVELEKTVRGLQAVCSPGIVAGITLLLAHRASAGCLRTSRAMAGAGFAIPVEVVVQPSRDVLGCVTGVLSSGRDISHFLFLMADYFLESEAIAGLIDLAARDRSVIYKFSRALPGGRFSPEYRPGELPLYRCFTLLLRLSFRSGVTDPIFSVMVAPVQKFLPVRIREKSLMFWTEWLFILMRGKEPIIEIPAYSLPRTGPDYTFHNMHRLHYLPVAIRARFAPQKSLWEEGCVPREVK